MKKWIEVEFEIGDMVYLKTDKEQLKRVVTSISVTNMGQITYYLYCGTVGSSHYGFEISTEIDVVVKVTSE